MIIPLAPLYPQDYAGFLTGVSGGAALASPGDDPPTKTKLPVGTVPDDPTQGLPGRYGDVFGKGGPFDLGGIDLSWLNPGGAIKSAANTAISYAGLALLGVLLIVLSVYVILNDRGAP